MIVLGIDPGREKCGLAVLSGKKVLIKRVISRSKFLDVVKEFVGEYNVESIVIGDGTGSKEFYEAIRRAWPKLAVATVDEKHTTEEARDRYWVEHKPKGLKRLLPTSMQVPPEPYDDYVAVILAERFLRTQSLS